MGATCLTPTVSPATGDHAKVGNTVQVRFNAPAAGTYYIAIKFNAQNLIGEPAPSPEQPFTTTSRRRVCLIRPVDSISSNTKHLSNENPTREDMKTKPNNFARASALQITFSIALIFVFAILLASARVATPILGNYPDTTLALSTDTTVTPDAPPTNTTSINVSTSTDFNGTLAGDPTTGVVRVTDAHPAGTYTVTVTAFDSGGATATKTFTLTVTTPVTCNPVSFAAATNFGAWP